MKRENVPVIITLIAAATYLISLQFPKNSRPVQAPREEAKNVEQELKIQHLSGLLQAMAQAKHLPDNESKERPEAAASQKLQEVIAQKQALEQELIQQARASLELARPAKQRLSEQEQNLSRQLKEKENAALSLKNQLGEEKAKYDNLSKNFNNASLELKRIKNTKTALERAVIEAERIKDELKQTNVSLKAAESRAKGELKEAQAKLSLSFQEKESAIKQKDEALRQKEQLRQSLEEFKQANQRSEKELGSLENSIEQLDKEKLMLKYELEEAKKLNLNTQKLQQELAQLRAQLELLNKTYADLQNEHTVIQQALKQNEIDLGSRADRILVSEEKLKIAQAQLADTQLKYKDIEKDTSLLREQNVAVQIEREGLKNQLQQARLRLSELENQTLQISSILNTAKTTPAPAPAKEDTGRTEAEPGQRVEVELYPAETITQEAGK